jgi:single-strand DNA-binding protein
MYTTKGTIKVINQTQVISESFSKREFVIETDGQYPKPNAFQVTKDKCSLLDNFKVGQQVEVFWNLNGKEWTSPAGEVKYFNTLEAWRLERLDGNGESIQDKARVDQMKAHAPNEEENDLPF